MNEVVSIKNNENFECDAKNINSLPVSSFQQLLLFFPKTPKIIFFSFFLLLFFY